MAVRVSVARGLRRGRGRRPGHAVDAWSRRHAASLVKLLALADGRRLHREQVIDALWPGLGVEAAAPRLHKAAHYARRALGDERRWPGPSAATWCCCCPTPTSSVDVARVPPQRPEGAGRRHVRGRASRAGGVRPGRAAARGPLRAMGRRARGTPCTTCTSTCSAGPGAGRSSSCTTRPTRRPTSRWPASTSERGDRRAALRQLERTGSGAAPRARHRAQRCRRDAAPRSWRSPRQRSTTAHSRAGVGDWSGGVSRGRRDPRAGSTGRPPADGGTLLLVGPAGVGKSALLDLAAALAARTRRRSARGAAPPQRRGPLAVRPGARGVRRPLPQPPGPARRAGRRLPRRARASAVRAARAALDAASPRTSGCSSPPPSCSAWPRATTGCCSSSTTCTRPTRRRCGCCTTWPGAR